jgi:iron complex outermembrane receptor protein
VVLPRFSVDLQASGSWYGYASLARGARSGGINTLAGLDEEERTFHPEYNWTSELGLRFQGHAAIQAWQATVYRIDWRNTQIIGVATTPGVSSLITRNTAGVTTHGLETQLQIRIGRAWTGRAAFSWTQPRFVSGSDDAGSRAFCGLTGQPPSSTFCEFGAPRSTSNGNIQLVPYLDGNLLSRVPRRSLTLGLQSKAWALAQGWQLNVGGQFAWQDSVYERPINGARYGGRRLLGLRAGLERQAWRLELWGTNLTDERYVRVASGRGGAFYPSLPRPIDLLYGEGRRIGLTVTRDLSAP